MFEIDPVKSWVDDRGRAAGRDPIEPRRDDGRSEEAVRRPLDVYEELDPATAIHRRLALPVLDVSDLSVEETAMRVIKLVADRQPERTLECGVVSERSVWRARAAPTRKVGAARYWAMWFVGIAVAVPLFYVILTPVWIGLGRSPGSPSSRLTDGAEKGVDLGLGAQPRHRVAPELAGIHCRRERCVRSAYRIRAFAPHGHCEGFPGCRCTPPRALTADARSAAASRGSQTCTGRSSQTSAGLPENEWPISASHRQSPTVLGEHRLEQAP